MTVWDVRWFLGVSLGVVSAACDPAPPAPAPTSAPASSAAAAPPAPPATAAPPAPPATAAPGVVYACPEPPDATPAACAEPPSPRWLVGLDVWARRIGETEGPAHDLAPRSYCRFVEGIVEDGLAADPAALSWEERVVAQSAALRLAVGPGCDGHDTPRKRALALVTHLALDAEALEALGSEPLPAASAWIGERATWIDRHAHVPLRHDETESFVAAFRPVRAGSRRAVFDQLVAIDRDGAPHVTPLVGRIEMRLGMEPDAPACVVHLDARRLRCAGERYHAVAFADVPDAEFSRGFLRRAAPGRVGCTGCHGPRAFTEGGVGVDHPFFGDLRDLEPAERDAHLAARRAALLEGAKAKVADARRDAK